MKKITTFLTLIGLLSSGITAQSVTWGDTGTSGLRESANTNIAHPGRYVVDGNINSYWQLTSGNLGWIEQYWATPQWLSGATVDVKLASGVNLFLSRLDNGHWVEIPGSRLQGPIDNKVDLYFAGDLKPTSRILVTLSGDQSSQCQVRELAVQTRTAPQPFGKILPQSYSINQPEYINLKASRLWDGIVGAPWFDPLWSTPWEVFQTDTANKPTAIFPPYVGNPPKDAEIIWELGTSYQVETLKAYFQQDWRNLQFEFWDGAKWASAQTFGSGFLSTGTGWQQINLKQPVTTSRIRITFPGGWERARYIGELEVWGSGWSPVAAQPLTLSDLGADKTRLFTIDGIAGQSTTAEVVVQGLTSVDLTGDWNGTTFDVHPATWMNQETIYRVSLDATTTRAGTQFLRLQNADAVLSVNVQRTPDRGLIDLGWPYSDGVWDHSQASPTQGLPTFKAKTWNLGGSYSLEQVRVWGNLAPQLTLKTGVTGKKGTIQWTQVSWKSTGDGWWQAALGGQVADQLALESLTDFTPQEIEVTGSRLFDQKVDFEIWWPQQQTVTSNSGDGNSVIGWMGDPSVQPLIGGFHPRQADKLFWMPLSQMGMDADQETSFPLLGQWGSLSYSGFQNVRWSKNPPGTLDQGESFVSTQASTLAISGTLRNSQYRVFVNGSEVANVSGHYSTSVALVDGYQKISVEVWNKPKASRLIAWTKEVYKTRGLPLVQLDLPRGDLWTQNGSYTVSGHVGNGTGLALTINGKAVALDGDLFSWPVPLTSGAQNLPIVLTDGTGQKTTQSLVFNRDNLPPQIAITFPSLGTYLSQSSINFTTTSAGESGLWWRINQEDWEFDPTTPHVRNYRLADGFYNYSVTAQDRAGNVSSTQNVNFVIDVTPPKAFIIGANVTGWTSNNHPILTFATTDETSGVDHYELQIDSSGWSTQVSPYQVPTLSDGIHQVFVKAIDKAGNATVESIELDTDILPPVAFTPTVNVTAWTSNNRPTLTFTTTDATSGVARYDVQIDTGAWSSQVSPYQLPTLADGLHTVAVRAVDKAGNTTTEPAINLQIDATAPETFVPQVDVTGWTNNNQPTLTFATADATSGLDHWEVQVDSNGWTTQVSPYQVPTLADGAHTLTVRAVDRAGNPTPESLVVQIDTTPPVAVTDFRGIPGKDRIDVLWTTVDSDVVFFHVVRITNSGSTSFDLTRTSWADEDLDQGTSLQFKVQPVDRAGNLGPWSTADAAIAGIAVKAIDPTSTTPVLVEYQGIKMVVPAASLPPEVKEVTISEVTDADLVEGYQNNGANPLVGPVYNFASTQLDDSGNSNEATHTEFSKEVVVVLDYDPSQIPNGLPESSLGVYYYDTTWSRWFRVEKAAVDTEQKKIVFLTNHFSSFSVQPTMLNDLAPQQLKDAGHSPYKSESRAGEVTVSPQGGTMSTEVTEFVLAGKNGYTYPIKRTYDTQTARVDSPSLNLSMSLGINFTADLPAQIVGQLVSSGVSLSVGSITSKISGIFKRNGDYPLAMGIGWRLNLPYVMADDTTVMVRLASGGYYGVNQMELQGSAPLISGARTLTFENHRGEDFTFTVHQARTDLIPGILSTGNSEIVQRIAKSILGIKDDDSGSPVTDSEKRVALMKDISKGLSFARTLISLIPGWQTLSSELITKDGTTYAFDALGRVIRITDPARTNVIQFTYSGSSLESIADPLGNLTTFEYDGDGSNAFLRPSITKVKTSGPHGTMREATFQYDTNDNVNSGFMTLPAMVQSTDVGGRVTNYGIDKRFLFSGGGSAKINFIAALLNVIDPTGTLNSTVGISTLSISGHLNFEWPRLINRIEAPGLGVTEVSYTNKDLSQFSAEATDFLFGLSWLPTALKVSYEFLYRVITDGVTFRNGSLSKHTSYGYHFTSRENQWIVDGSTVDDGLTTVNQSYSIYSRTYSRYVSFDDAFLSALKQGVFTEQSNDITEYYPLATSTTTIIDATGATYESQSETWDSDHQRPLTQAISRGPAYSQNVAYGYDNWGNQISVDTTQVTPRGSSHFTKTSWYWGTSSVAPAGLPAGLVTTPNQVQSQNKALLLAVKTAFSRPGTSDGAEYQGWAYDSLGRIVWQGTWADHQWAAGTRTYDPNTGWLQSSVNPMGQKTDYRFDTSSLASRSLWVKTQTDVNVADPLGIKSNVVTETAYDLGTSWPRLVKSAEGYVTETLYDSLGRPTGIVKPGNEGAIQPGAWTINRVQAPWDRIVYEDQARTVSLYKETANGTSLSSTVTNPSEFYEYDSRGNLTRINKYDRSAGTTVTSQTQAGYDAYNRVTSMTNPIHQATSYGYDFLSRVTLVTNPDQTTVATTWDDTTGIKTTTNERGVQTQEKLNWNQASEVTTADLGGLGLTTVAAYDGLGRPVSVMDPLNQITTFTYNGLGKPSVVTHPAIDSYNPPQTLPTSAGWPGTISIAPVDQMTYDDNGNLIQKRTGAGSLWRTSSTTFDGLGRAIQQNQDGRAIWTWYNGSGQQVAQTDGDQTKALVDAGASATLSQVHPTLTTYTGRGQILTSTDPMGAITTYNYDRDDHKILMRDPRAQGTLIEDFSIHYIYDDLGRLVSANLPPVGTLGRGKVTFTYDLRGNPLTQTDADGKITTWTYDQRNRKTSQTMTGTDGKTLVSAWNYDLAGNTTEEIVVSSPNSLNPGASSGLVTSKNYDGLNRLVEVDLPDGQKTFNELDGLGRVKSVTDAAGHVTNFLYNSLNKVIQKTDALGNVTLFRYNQWGDATAQDLGNGTAGASGDQVWVRQYNAWSQVVYEANKAGQTWSHGYNQRGLPVTVTDPNGTTTTNGYDLAGRIISKALANGTKTQSQGWTYDLAGSLKTATDGSVTTLLNQATGSFVADPYDLVWNTTTTVAGKTLTQKRSFDLGQRPVSLTYPDGQTITIQYNGLGQLTSIPGYASDGSYNFMGRLTGLTAVNGTARTKTWNATTGNLDGYDWKISGKTARGLTWDNRGNLTGLTKDQTSNTYSYDDLNRLGYAQEGGPIEVDSQMLTGTSFGAREQDVGGRNGLDYSNQSVRFDYHATSVGINLGSLKTINKVRLNGASTRTNQRTVEVYLSNLGTDQAWSKVTDGKWVPDETGGTIEFNQPHQAQFVKLHMTWDERDATNTAIDQHTIAGSPSQLIQVWFTVNGQNTSWTYDSLGNRLAQNQYKGVSVVTGYSYYPNSSLIKTAGEWSFAYDANGNLTGRSNSVTGEVWLYGYDLLNRLANVQRQRNSATSLNSLVSYVYDANNLKVLQTKGSVSTAYQYDPSGDLLWSDDGTTQIKYIQALGQTWAEAQTTGGTSVTYWHSTDHEGSTNVITDSTGKVVWDGEYEAFGSVVRSNGTLNFTPSYTGKQFDQDTGLYYYNARWYDPTLGRFLSSDPAGVSENWYWYGSANPLRNIDPSGLDDYSWLLDEDGNPDNSMGPINRLGNEAVRQMPEAFATAGKDLAAGFLLGQSDSKAGQFGAALGFAAMVTPAGTAKSLLTRSFAKDVAVALKETSVGQKLLTGSAETNALTLHPFANGGTHLTTTERLEYFKAQGSKTYGSSKDGLFLVPTDQANALLSRTSGRNEIEIALGLRADSLAGGDLVRIDVKNPFSKKLRLPETGNEFFRKGVGQTTGNLNEGVIDAPKIGTSGVKKSIIEGK